MASERESRDWLTDFVAAAEYGEAPQYMYFWTGIATIAAVLRRKVWIDMGEFVWYPNLYTLIVAPPGVVQKSTTADIGMRMLAEIPGIHFGPATLTWQALYDAFAEVGEEFQIGPNEMAIQFPLVINSSEFGITLNPKDTEMIDQLVHIWDNRPMSKRTRKDGELKISSPCLNMIACTTPSWIAENVPAYLIGGGLTSRMLFVYADEKARYNAYPKEHMPPDHKARKARLQRDLERISQLVGEFQLTPEAIQWGTEWYEHFHKVEAKQIDKTLLGGYIARKQTLVHKVAMILVVSRGNTLIIDRPDLERAVALITELEKNMPKVYDKIGMSQHSQASVKVLAFLDRNGGQSDFNTLFRFMHRDYPDAEMFEKILMGMMEARYIKLDVANRKVIKL